MLRGVWRASFNPIRRPYATMVEVASSSSRPGAAAAAGATPSANGSSNGSRGKAKAKARRGKGPAGPAGAVSSQSSASKGTPPAAKAKQQKSFPNLAPPIQDKEYIMQKHHRILESGKAKKDWVENPKGALANYVQAYFKKKPMYENTEGYRIGERTTSMRSHIRLTADGELIGYGDARNEGEAKKLAAMDLFLQLMTLEQAGVGIKELAKSEGSKPGTPKPAGDAETEFALLSDKTKVTADKARAFMDFYCAKFGFGRPAISLEMRDNGKKAKYWVAEMKVGGAKIGFAEGANQKIVKKKVYLDTVVYLEKEDSSLWRMFESMHRSGAVVKVADPVTFSMSEGLEDEMLKYCDTIRGTNLYANRPRLAGHIEAGEANVATNGANRNQSRQYGQQSHYLGEDAAMQDLQTLSDSMSEELSRYQSDRSMDKMRAQRYALPVQMMASDVLVKIELNQVTIIMAATGSGKTTQLPQMILDDQIMQGQGAHCNIVVTQPRRIAAISVAQRVAKERSETIGKTIGYAVRFDHRPPRRHGGINYCTTGYFLRRLQAALGEEDEQVGYLDDITHIVIDEVHERDIETDLLLVVLRKILAERKRLGKREIKVVLMSATIDPALFCQYFADPASKLPAPVVTIPGRSFPVTSHFLEETHARLRGYDLPDRAGGWIWKEKNVQKYLERELNFGVTSTALTRDRKQDTELDGEDAEENSIDTLELPYPFIALMIADIVMESEEGHILVFLPGMEDIKAVRNILEDSRQYPLLDVNFSDRNKFEVHVLHSSVAVEDQQAIFEPTRGRGVRRVILATNIAETSITIPDVVYVVDSGKSKETHYEPNRHLQRLVPAWVGASNVNQRAGRAGRHREGHAFALMTRARFNSLKPSAMVAMKRENLSNIVMNIKAMNMASMEAEEILAEAIEPPAPERVRAAISQLIELGALDAKKDLTSLGQVLAKMSTDANIGKMCLYGAFFRCLDSTLSLAAVLTERSPWIMAEAIRDQTVAVKASWGHPQFRSDALATLRALKQYEELSRTKSYHEVRQFCNNNFLHSGAMQTMLQVKGQLHESLSKAGVLKAVLRSSSTLAPYSRRGAEIDINEPEINFNSTSLPLLSAMLAMSSTPNFALRTKPNVLRTSQDKTCFVEPSSVNSHRVMQKSFTGERDLYAYQAKTTSSAGTGTPPLLRGVTILDPLTYMLFGATRIESSADGGMICDNWLPLTGDSGALDNVERLRKVIDLCMLRVFEAIEAADTAGVSTIAHEAKTLSETEAMEFSYLTRNMVGILEKYSEERFEEYGAAEQDMNRLGL